MRIPNSWTFKRADVAAGFDAHVREQLPWYDLAHEIVAHTALLFMPDGGKVYDIGASTGNLSDKLRDRIQERFIHWVSIDNAAEMADHFRGVGSLVVCDAMVYPYGRHNLSVLFLSLMFFPVDERAAWLRSLYDRLAPGGALIVVDKQEGKGGALQTELHRFTMRSKVLAGAAPDDVLRKEFSLPGIQNPLPRDFFAGYPHVTEIFRAGDFAAWVIEKKEETS